MWSEFSSAETLNLVKKLQQFMVAVDFFYGIYWRLEMVVMRGWGQWVMARGGVTVGIASNSKM